MEKNAPLARPLTITKTVKGAREVLIGQIASMLSALSAKLSRSELTGPRRSPKKPNPSLPHADARFHPASSSAPVKRGKPSVSAYMGMKKGGTSKGKVPIAPARARRRNLASLNSCLGSAVKQSTYHSTKDMERRTGRSLIRAAAGRPSNKVTKPKARKDHAAPSLLKSLPRTTLKQAPPRPPPA